MVSNPIPSAKTILLIYVIKLLVIAKNSCDNLFVYAHGTIYYINTV